MNDFIAKPIDASQLLATMAKWVTPKEPQPIALNPAESEGDVDEALLDVLASFTYIDTQDGLKRVGGATLMYVKLLKRFAANQKGVVEAAEAALQEDRYDDAIRFIHTLKSSAGSIGAIRLFQLAKDSEAQMREQQVTAIAHAEEVKGLLNAALNEISRVSINAKQNAVGDPKGLFDKLNEQLRHFDTAAEDTIEMLLGTSLSDAQRASLEDVGCCIEQYDFDRAQSLCQHMEGF